MLGNVAWVVYSGLKLGTEAIGRPELMRTDKDKPNAPVGGLNWMNRGVSDGFDDVGDVVGDIRLHVPEDAKRGNASAQKQHVPMRLP